RKKIASWLFYKFSQRITNIKYEKGLGVFRAMKREAVKNLINVPEMTGTVLSLLYWSGISYVSVPLKRDKRFAGTTGYTLKKMFKLSSERIFSYSLFPMRLMTNTGLIIGFLSIVVGLFFIFRKFFISEVLPGWTSLIVIVSFLFGLNFIFMGLLGEYIGRIYLETKKRPKYVTETILDSLKED
ncbi:MAG: glycosyltransferase, partial [Candidatus Delongbacteria bacterium]|nr:glycosyltransferase [Candidatus Delongbacteria bacterium]